MINKPAATRPDASDNSMTEATSMTTADKDGMGAATSKQETTTRECVGSNKRDKNVEKACTNLVM